MDDPARIVAAGHDAVADRYAALEEEDGAWPRSRRVAELARQLAPGTDVLGSAAGTASRSPATSSREGSR